TMNALWRRTLIATLSIGCTAIGAMAAEATCECQPTEGYLVTRLWDIVSINWTDQDVIDEFNDGFAPKVTHMDGFYRYTAAKTGNSSTVFFMNIFDTEEHARAAQEGARAFVAEGALEGNISPNQFTEDKIISSFNSEECVKSDSTGLYLATRFNEAPPRLFLPGNLTSDLEDANEKLESISGYRSFVASESADGEQSFFFNVYETPDGARESNDFILEANANDGDVQVKIHPTMGRIAFDYICAAFNAPDAPDVADLAGNATVVDPPNETASGEVDSSASENGVCSALYVALAALYFVLE
ncbi:hypothetical protein ACHAWF_003461, partial [Thalassiosira exigua]